MRRVLWLARREYLAAVRTKGFIIALIIAPVVMGGSGITMAIMKNRVDTKDQRVAIIHRGVLVREGMVAELLQDGQGELRLQVNDSLAAQQVLAPEWLADLPEKHPADPLHWLTIRARADQSPEIVRRLVAAGIDVYQVVVRRQSLEEFFMAVTNSGEQNHA